MVVEIKVESRIATALSNGILTAMNGGDTIKFHFDDEWEPNSATATRTARFIYDDNIIDLPFNGNVCPLPTFRKPGNIYVGVFWKGIRSSTPARLIYEPSVMSKGGLPDAPPDDVYERIIEMMDEKVNNKQLVDAVEDSLKKAKDSGTFDGKSVEVTKVEETQENGQANKVYFSDGKVLSVLNGKDGKDCVATIEECIGLVCLKPDVFRYYLKTDAGTTITCEDISQFPLGYTASIVVKNSKEHDEMFGQINITSDILKKTSDNGMPLTELTNSVGNNGTIIHVYRAENVEYADKFNWYLSTEKGENDAETTIEELQGGVRLTPNCTRYYTSPDAGGLFINKNEDFALFPNGYHATIVYFNHMQDDEIWTEKFGQSTIRTEVLKNCSDDGLDISQLTLNIGNNGVVINVYKVEGADKFNWYLSTEIPGAAVEPIQRGVGDISLTPECRHYLLLPALQSANINSFYDIFAFPSGYTATIVFTNDGDEGTAQFDNYTINTDVLKDVSDNGTPLSELTLGKGRGGIAIHVYKVEGADKFNWYLSNEGGSTEVHVGKDEPTDENVVVWIDTDGEGTSGEWEEVSYDREDGILYAIDGGRNENAVGYCAKINNIDNYEKVKVEGYQYDMRYYSMCLFLDANGAVVEVHQGVADSTVYQATIDVPENAKTLIVNGKIYAPDPIRVEGYRETTFDEHDKVKLMTLGDSITALGTSNEGWVKYFIEKTECELVANVAVIGAWLKDKEGTVYDGNPVFNGADNNVNNVLGNQVQKIIDSNYEAPDIIMIAIGTNGGINITKEQIKAVYYDDNNDLIPLENVDRTTSAGAYRWCLEKLHAKYPNATIFWCTPIMGHQKIRSAENIMAYAESLRIATEYTGQIMIDTIRCGINGINEHDSANGEYLIDGLHPNENGAKKIGYYNASKVIPFLRKDSIIMPAVLKVKDENGNWVDIPALKGGKGDAYILTETDKTEMANAVLNALPVYEGEVEEV